MSLEIMRDPRVRSVEWRDLVPVTRWEVVKEVLLSLPWLAASLVLASFHLYPLALACSFIFFLCGLRQVHNAYHYAVGIPRQATEHPIWRVGVHTRHHDSKNSRTVSNQCSRLLYVCSPWKYRGA